MRVLPVFCLCWCNSLETRHTMGAELVGISVTPHVQSSNLRWRRAPDSQLGARVELFLKNNSEFSIPVGREFPCQFDGQTPQQLVTAGQWAWYDMPPVWSEPSKSWPPETLIVLSFNTRTNAWGGGTEHSLSLGGFMGGAAVPLALTNPEAWLSAVTFRGANLAAHPTGFVVHVANHGAAPLSITGCRVWLPGAGESIHVFRRSSSVQQMVRFPQDGVIPAGEKGGLVVECEPLPLGYGVIEVVVAQANSAERSLWAHLRIKPEVFDISGGWVASDVNGRNSLTLEPYLKTLKRMHINTGHIGDVPGYTDNAQLYAAYPLKLFNKLVPVEQFDNDQILPRVHGVEFLGEPQYGGGRPVAPQKVWEELTPYQATRLPTTVTHSEERIWRDYAGLSDYPHYDAYRVCAPAADNWTGYDRWGDEPIRWGAPLETIGDMTRSLRELYRPRPIAYWSQGAHAGWGGRRGRTRSSPTPDELRSQAYHALANRITSLYWFNLSLKSLLKFPDLIEPITRVDREIRLIDEILLEGDAWEYRRVLRDGQPDWDLSSVVAPQSGVFFANDLAYAVKRDKGEFQFEHERVGEFRFPLPGWLAKPAEVFRVDADGTHDVECSVDAGTLVVRDKISVAGIYIVARQQGSRAKIDQRHAELLALEQSVGFDPANNPDDLEVLQELVKR